MQKKCLILTGSILLCIILLFAFSISFGYFGVWTEGMSFISTDNKHYTFSQTPVEGKFDFTVRMDDLESNTGKVVYRDENGYIDISVMDSDSGQYRIHFRSHGRYTRRGAVLISGASHPAHTYNVDASLSVILGDISYPCSVAGVTGVSYKDGDMFSFYIPSEVIKDDTETLSFQLSDLVQNRWHRKN